MARIQKLIAGAAVAALAGGGLLLGATAASAATTPPWEPDPQSLGTLAFYNSAGVQVLGGNDLTNAFAYVAASNHGGSDQAGATKASIGYAFPSAGSPTSAFFVQPAGGNTPFPNHTAPANIAALTTPVNTVVGGGGDLLDNVIPAGQNDPTSGYNDILQVRLYTSGGGSLSTPTAYWESDISYDTASGTWAEVFPTTAGHDFLTTALPSVPVDVAYKASVVASGGTGPYKYTATGLPTGIKIATTGALSGTPLAAGDYPVTVTATDAAKPTPHTFVETFYLNVTPMAITTTSLPGAVDGVTYKAAITHSGGKAALHYSVTGSLPPGILMSASTGAFSGAAAGVGMVPQTFTFNVHLTDSTKPVANTAVQTLSITVAPMTVSTATTSFTTPVGKAFTGKKLLTVGGKTAFHWSKLSGTLPPGITLSTAGAFAGTPTTAGTFSFVAQVIDSGKPAATATATVTITVTPMAITTATLPNGIVKKAYSAKLAEVGGKAPLVYTVSAGMLPPGLKLSTAGAFTGSPTTAGTYTFTVTLKDGTKPVANLAFATYTITIS